MSFSLEERELFKNFPTLSDAFFSIINREKLLESTVRQFGYENFLTLLNNTFKVTNENVFYLIAFLTQLTSQLAQLEVIENSAKTLGLDPVLMTRIQNLTVKSLYHFKKPFELISPQIKNLIVYFPIIKEKAKELNYSVLQEEKIIENLFLIYSKTKIN